VVRVRTADRRGLKAAQYPKPLRVEEVSKDLAQQLRPRATDYFVGNSRANLAVWQEGNFEFAGPFPLTTAQEN
jgi:hypothetical protein